MKEINGYEFWKRVDAVRGDKSLVDISNGAGINYQSIKNQRSSNHVPRLQEAVAIADYLNVSIGYLVGDATENDFEPDPELRALVEDLKKADPTTLALIRMALKNK